MNDSDLLDAFENQSISNEDWSHEFHIRIAAIYLFYNDFDEALVKVKLGIQKLNAANKVPNSQFRGFHETLTIGWLKLIDARLRNSTLSSSLELINKNRDLLNSRLLSNYYSSDRLMSLEAKAKFIEPDIRQFA